MSLAGTANGYNNTTTTKGANMQPIVKITIQENPERFGEYCAIVTSGNKRLYFDGGRSYKSFKLSVCRKVKYLWDVEDRNIFVQRL